MSKTTLFDSRIKKYAYREAAQLYGELGSSPAGLSPEQVERQREKYGSNCFGSRSSDTMLRRLRRAFINPFNVILYVLGSISLVTDGLLASDFSKNATTALIIFSMILISGGIRLVQELRAKNAAQQLDRLIHQRIRVRRGGVCTFRRRNWSWETWCCCRQGIGCRLICGSPLSPTCFSRRLPSPGKVRWWKKAAAPSATAALAP